MNLDQIEAILAVVEQGSFRAAADRLNKSQPALSTSIKNLEDEFNILIFDRSEYRPKLTEAGTAFLNVAKATLEAAQYAARVAAELGKNEAETKLHISVDPLISTEVIEAIVLECSRPTYPVNLILDKSILSGSLQPLISGEVDLALAPNPKTGSDALEGIHLEDVTLVGAVSRKLLQEHRTPTCEFLRKHPHIFVYDKRFDEPPDEFLPNDSSSIGHKIFVPDHFTKLKLIEDGVGWGRISRMEFDKNADLVMIDKEIWPPLTLELCLLRPKRRAIGPIARAIWQTFKLRASLAQEIAR